MRNSAYFRMFIVMALIVFISFSVLGALSTVLSYRRTMAERREMMTRALQETARYVETQHLGYGIDLDNFDISMHMTMTSRITGLDMLLTDAAGVVVSCSELALVSLGTPIPDEFYQTIETGNHIIIVTSFDYSHPIQRMITGSSLAMSMGGEMRTYGYLFVTSDMAVSASEWRNFSTAFILLALSVMSLTFVMSFIASKKQTKPLNEIASAARRFARGDYNVRVDENLIRRNEVEQLAKAFNYMAQSLQTNEELRRDFIANLSHELRTPMTVISGFAEGLLDGTIPREQEARYLSIISSETKRLARLVRSMLEISMLGETTAEALLEDSFDISEVIRLALLSLDSGIEKKHLDIEAELSEDPVITRGNRDSIYQVVYNLIENAIKYSFAYGKIKLELWQQDLKVFVSITNQGETIPSEELPNIFRRFHKIDKSRSVDREGVGLGLYIVKAMLDKHNEDIYVTSADGITKFIFSLTAV